MRALFPAVLAASTCAPALAADPIDLSRGWGNKDGCINKVQQEAYSEIMLLLTSRAFVTATGYCEIEKTSVNEDGSLTLSTMCQTEGKDPVPSTLTVKRSARNENRIVVSDEDGNAYRELSQCP